MGGLICILNRSSGVEAFISPPPKDPSLFLKPPWKLSQEKNRCFSYQYRLLGGGFPRLWRHLCRLVPHYGGVGCDNTKTRPVMDLPLPLPLPPPGVPRTSSRTGSATSLVLHCSTWKYSCPWAGTRQSHQTEASSSTQSGRKRQERRAG